MTVDPRLQSENNTGNADASVWRRDELEQQVAAAISEHRQLFESDQAVYEEWERASEDPKTAPGIVQSLQDEYLRRRQTTAAHQEILASLLDMLGYVPHVPTDADDD